MNNKDHGAVEARVREITAELKALRTTIDTQDEAVAELVKRLSSIISPGIDENAKDDVTQPTLVPLAEEIHEEADRVHRNTLRVEDLLRRIEL